MNKELKTTSLELFRSGDGAVTLDVHVQGETLWLTQAEMATLFGVSRSAVTKHLANILKTGELVEESICSILEHVPETRNRSYQTAYYNLDAIIAVGYRVNSKRATQFRIWATDVLKRYILHGYAVNDHRLAQLGEIVKVMRRAGKRLDAAQVLSVVEQYSIALDLLDEYDHQTIRKPKGSAGEYVLTYDECRKFIDSMKFAAGSELFGNEKDGSFKGAIGNIYQTFGGKELYPAREEKAANLLYFVIKNHAFSDGNKRIGAAIFLYFLEKNGLLRTTSGEKRVADDTLVALTVMIAESKPAERELMTNLVMTFLVDD